MANNLKYHHGGKCPECDGRLIEGAVVDTWPAIYNFRCDTCKKWFSCRDENEVEVCNSR